MTKRILSQIEMLSEEERDYYQREARKLGFSTFAGFAKVAMIEKIEKADPLYNAFCSILEICNENETWLQEVDLSDDLELSDVEKEALKVIRVIEQLIIRTRVIKDNPESFVYLDPAAIEEGEDPLAFRYALVKDDYVDSFFKS